ncbi:MAG: orotidine-5'-phosphate decarboxylase [Gammaproteobacteria bacterium]|nr:MAG: orotidine-5'-phosphate decarboxylase [Gammaproteobacteria bacterium]
MSKQAKVIVALDYPDRREAVKFAETVSPRACKLKIGLQLFVAEGPALVRELADAGYDIFLDLKFHDIPNTVAAACRSAASLGVWMLNVHCLGGQRMMRQAKQAVTGKNEGKPLLIGVTILTSHQPDEIIDIGLHGDLPSLVSSLAGQAMDSGLDGVVCSPWEAATLRQQFGSDIILVTPGIRPSGSDRGDQRRTMTPGEAIRAGSNYLVIGRPVTQSQDPAATLRQINEEIAQVLEISDENT